MLRAVRVAKKKKAQHQVKLFPFAVSELGCQTDFQ